MSRDKRLKEITDILHTKKRIDVKQLEKLTFSSISTLRRDLIYLEEQGFLTRKRGEVVLNSFNTVELAHSIRETENRDAKKKLQNLIIFTNGLNTAQMLADLANPTMKIFITGGEVKHHSASVINHNSENNLLSHFRIDLAFCSARGIDDEFVYEVDMQPFRELQHLLSKTSTNVNQIAKKVNNYSLVYKEDLKTIQNEIHHLSKELNKLQNILYNRTNQGDI
ncbi:TPA: DeoR/GlpR transcriptional regulator [Streptococcus suis]|uniref:DeoR family transcriptional regulator n=1 Tax=Streptococcus suis TaxID=1307 RepID=UPI002118EB49|nr:DeoR family transcriptional regulator [Streptococcus suis]MCQ8274016.1 DeoR family transcriptional regulator [Streptococcus suis]MDX5046224.1 DeoR family transcriptional regulator [Streptococcus suis]HEM2615553.1 DeoR/GlpR transcriptional regulator [Streptococcus suis]HEM2625379.1 DeoR/GlpR transcriptional regulator [Streptococcus suis]HEM2641308.1 DeoR/GlpR transcriptional regulator [Streptococcus suis]